MSQSESQKESPDSDGNPVPRNGRLLDIRGAVARRMAHLGRPGNEDSVDDSNLPALAGPGPANVLAAGPAPSSLDPNGLHQEQKRCDLLIEAGEAKNRSGEYAAAQDTLRKAAELAGRFQDHKRLARIAVALPTWHWMGLGQSNPLALLLAQHALAVEPENSSWRAILMARVAAELSYSPSQQERSRELATAAIDLAVTENSRANLQVRLFLDPLLRAPECASERLENAEEIVRLGVEVGDYTACFLGGLAKSAALSLNGNLAGANEVTEVAAEIVSVSGSPLHRGITIAWDISRAVMEGRFAEAEKNFGLCRNFAARNRIPYLLDACWPAMLVPLNEAGRIGEIEAMAEETVRRRPGALAFDAILSWIKMRLGKPQDAGFLLDRLAADEYLSLCQADAGWVGMAALAEVSIALNRAADAAILYRRLSPYAGFTAVLGGIAQFGSVEMYLGELAAGLGRFDEAAEHFNKSFAYNRRIGARPWVAYSRWGLARTFIARGGTRNHAQAAEILEQIEAEAGSLQMKRLLSRTRSLGERVRRAGRSSPPLSKSASSSYHPPEERGHRPATPVRPAAPNSHALEHPAASADSAHRTASFRRKGDVWELGFQGRIFWLKHCRGFDFIHFLLRNSGREFTATQIVYQGCLPGAAAAPDPEHAAAGESNAPLLDAQAKQAYRARLKELADDLEDARRANDAERIETIEEEKEFLARELARALGLFDRDRKFSAASDRARRCVRMAISRAIAAISRCDEEFAQLFVRSLHTGNASSFVPRVEDVFRWRL